MWLGWQPGAREVGIGAGRALGVSCGACELPGPGRGSVHGPQ